MKKKRYIPSFFNYICTYLLAFSLLLQNKALTIITGIAWIISIVLCYIETIFVVIPHILKNKRFDGRESFHWILEVLAFSPALMVSYISQYINKEKKDALITNLSTLICAVRIYFFCAGT